MSFQAYIPEFFRTNYTTYKCIYIFRVIPGLMDNTSKHRPVSYTHLLTMFASSSQCMSQTQLICTAVSNQIVSSYIHTFPILGGRYIEHHQDYLLVPGISSRNENGCNCVTEDFVVKPFRARNFYLAKIDFLFRIMVNPLSCQNRRNCSRVANFLRNCNGKLDIRL